MYVYLLQSINFPHQRYIGLTGDLKARIKSHNRGQTYHTAKYKPWKVKVAIWFEEPEKAKRLEKYLKHGSGHAYAEKHFW